MEQANAQADAQNPAQLALRKALEGKTMQDAMAQILPRHVTPQRIAKVVLSATARNEKILACTQASIIRAVMQSAELGLEIGGLLGEAYLVPFKKNFKDKQGRWQSVMEVQCIIGYQGLLKLARQSGEIGGVTANVICENDRFSIDLAQSTISHSPALKSRGGVVGAYAITELKGGNKVLEFMTLDEIEAIRKRSKTYDKEKNVSTGPWDTDYSEMARKTVLRRALKYVPRSSELSLALETDVETDGGSGDPFTIDAELVAQAADVTAHLPQRSTRSSALAQRIQETKGPPVQDVVVDEPADSGPVDVTPEPQRMREPGEEG